jgi:predicted unusual protein kinase regulating ubiquinone biosynthesis (AarF/ABC1/UbiB family)
MSPAAADDPWKLGGRVRRAATPARLLARGATAAAIAQARALRGDSVEDIAADPKLVSAAEDIARELGEMKGAAMKIGQALSVLDVALIPEEYRSALSVLQADAPAMPYDHVVEVVTDELGAPPEELFDFFSPKPIAAASIGQVHMAHVGDDELVVKVQYPGVARAVEADLRNAALLSAVARLLQRMTAGLVGDVDVRAVIDEVRDRISDELDYRIEAANQAEFAARFADDPEIDVPAVHDQWSTERVLTTSYVDAMRWSAALEEPQELRDRWGRVLARFFATTLYDHGVVNVDTHPGNYLFHEDGRVTFLDFGCVTRLTEEQRLRTRRLAAALMSGDEDAILDTFVEAGFLRTRSGFDAAALLEPLSNWMRGPRGPQPFRYSRELLSDIIAESMRLRVGINELKLLQRIDVPREHALLGRMSLGTEAVLAHLEATVDFREIYAQHLAGAIDVEPVWPDGSDADPPSGVA